MNLTTSTLPTSASVAVLIGASSDTIHAATPIQGDDPETDGLRYVLACTGKIVQLYIGGGVWTSNRESALSQGGCRRCLAAFESGRLTWEQG